MPNDAKCGLVMGVGLVMAVAIVFFHKDGTADAKALVQQPAAVTVGSNASDPFLMADGAAQDQSRARTMNLGSQGEVEPASFSQYRSP